MDDSTAMALAHEERESEKSPQYRTKLVDSSMAPNDGSLFNVSMKRDDENNKIHVDEDNNNHGVSNNRNNKRFIPAENSNVCRDFLNNVCSRGDSCKYDHPKGLRGDDEQRGQLREKFDFCDEFQYKYCTRSNCRFIHCARDDRLTYEETGRISEALARAVVAATGQRIVGGIPLCKEFINGFCKREKRCRFWHVDPEREQSLRKRAHSDYKYQERDAYPPQQRGTYRDEYPRSNHHDQTRNDYYGRRPRHEDDYYTFDSSRSRLPESEPYLAEENAVLRRKVDMLKQTLKDLQVANDALLGENSRLRAQAAANAKAAADINSATAALNGVLNNSAANLSQLTTPGVAVTSVLTPEQHLAVVSLAAAAAVQQSAPIVVHPSLAYSASSDGLQWSLAQMRR
uniref:C3H1-type domain-containing protein n=1 Tax=Romanomermis culicivorax TaxID=13658 RepID=A0A915JIW1_ROMCU